MNNIEISQKTVRMFQRVMLPIAQEGVISLPEYHEAIAQLTNLAKNGTLKPLITPRLVDQKEAAEMIGVAYSNFKKLEAEGAFPFKRKMVGSSVRYRNTDIIDFILSSDD